MDLSSFTPQQLEELKAALSASSDGRSPFRDRQLHDLRLPPTAEDPRPTFFWSATAPRNVVDLTRTAAYPRLMWDAETGAEITVKDAAAQDSAEAKGYLLAPPSIAEAPDALDALRQALASLPESDRALMAQEASKDRMTKIRTALADMTEAQVEALLASVEPAKRGPGRPRKEVA